MRTTTSSPNVTRVYGLGSNGAGQLGVGHYDDLSEPHICQFRLADAVKSSCGPAVPTQSHVIGNIKSVVAGGNHTLLLTEDGSLYACGNNEDGRCALSTDNSSLGVFTYVPWTQARNVTHVAAAWETSFFVQDARVVWVSGTGARGELGLGEDVLLATSPRVALDIWDQESQACEIVSITASMSHVVVLLSNGHVYGWGSCRKGQLGDEQKPEKILWRPHKIDVSGSIHGVAAGRDFTVLNRPDRDLVVLGDFKSNDDHQNSPLAKSSPELIAGWSTLYVLSEGHVEGYGLGRRGQLPPPTLPLVAQFSAGSEHCVALTADEEVVTWGWGEHGNCGTPVDDRSCVAGSFNSIPIPDRGDDSVVGVAAGCATSFVWTMSQS